jgi:hypothetical protein
VTRADHQMKVLALLALVAAALRMMSLMLTSRRLSKKSNLSIG